MDTLTIAMNGSEAHYRPQPYGEIDTQFIPAHQWPFALIELALSRGIEEHKLLRGTGIFREDIATHYFQLTPQQCFQLISNLQKYFYNHELGFLLGHELFTPRHTPATIALNNAENLHAALDILVDHQAQIMPLLDARCRYEQEYLVIYWQDAYGADANMVFLLEMMCTALNSLSRSHCTEPLPWQFHFTHNKPSYIEQYDVHLGNRVHFSSHMNAMSIARDYLYSPWKNCTADSLLFRDSVADPTSTAFTFQRGFLAETYTYLQNNIQRNPNLEQTAADFGMSSASFKRKLKKHHSHFQAQYDLARRDLAIMWLNQKGATNEQVAKKLHFYDVANLRRAFKKWTGKLPHAMDELG